MKKIVAFCIVLFLSIPAAFAQVGPPGEEVIPTVEDMVKSITSEQGGEEASAEAIMESVVESMNKRMQPKAITEQTVQSAISGTLVREEVAPEVNRESVEAIDSKTQRYSPRLKLDFERFPLRRISGKFADAVRTDDEVVELEQTNTSLTNDIVRRIQHRMKLETVRFEFKDRTARVIGTVETERKRELVEMMLRLEPGIDLVKNELTVEKK